MNAERRKRIAELAVKLDEVQSELQQILEEEEEYRGNMPESFQSGGRYADSEAISDALADIDDWLGDAIESLCEISECTI